MDIKGSSILITGGTRGLGHQYALDLASLGAQVGVCARKVEGLKQLEADFSSQRLKVWIAQADVSKEEEVERLFGDFVEHYGRIDAIVNNAGITRDALLVKWRGDQLVKMPSQYWQEVIDVNLTGAFLCGREAAYHMVRQGTGGVIVLISSVCRHGNIGQTNYAATKSGVAAMTVVWAKELARHGIRVGTLAPGYISTEMTEAIREDVRERIVSSIPLRRMGSTREASHALRFILENDYVNGRVIEVDGGLRI